jgi:hypothetical protein
MKRKFFVALLVVLLSIAIVTPAYAIVWGTPDTDNTYSNVGFYIFYDSDPVYGGWYAGCSGTLVAENVFLTAGHCTINVGDQAWVAFKPSLTTADFGEWVQTRDGKDLPKEIWHHGTAHTDYQYGGPGDIGVVLLDKPVKNIPLAQIAPPGFLDSLSFTQGLQNRLMTIVGYGIQDSRLQFFQADDQRYYGTPMIVDMYDTASGGHYIQLTSDNSEVHPGGVCFGDSGGPAIYDGKVTGVGHAVANQQCAGVSIYYRVDTASAWDFLGKYLNR